VPTTRKPSSSRTARTTGTIARADGKLPQSPRRGSDLDLEIVTITPKLAQEWLDRGGTNRNITRRRIDAMTAAIVRASGD
jgi:hypothetical protein